MSIARLLVWLAAAFSVQACTAAEQDDGESSSSAYSQSPGAAATQMKEIVSTAHDAAAGKNPGGRCYAAVARYIDTNGYGLMKAQPEASIGALPAIPAAYGTYAHEFADYVNAGHADALGLKRLALDNPYDAPAGAIVVVRAGTPGTSHPTAGDIAIAAGDGVFYNDGSMSYGGRASFPRGNDFVLGIYVPKGASVSAATTSTCDTDKDCSGGKAHTGRVCGNDHVCIAGCHADQDCKTGQTCSHASEHWTCR